MRIRVSEPRYLRDLILFLRECDCVAEQASDDEAEVFVPSSRNEQAARLEVGLYLSAWRIRDETASAEIVER